MKKVILAAILAVSSAAMAQNVTVERHQLGSGQENAVGVENAEKWSDGIYHAPQYLPFHPTTATLYPRVVDLPCNEVDGTLQCAGFNWRPELGRGEYLMIRPVVQKEKAPRVIHVEVERKKKGE